MAHREKENRMVRPSSNRTSATRWLAISISWLLLFAILHATVPSTTHGGEPRRSKRNSSRSRASAQAETAKEGSRLVKLDIPGQKSPKSCEVVLVPNSAGKPSAYYMDVPSVVCSDAKCKDVSVRLHFDPVGNYQRYQLPPGENLTKLGDKPFSTADHEKLHQILSDPYSQLKTIGMDEVTVPKSSAAGVPVVDAISQPTMLSKQNAVVVGAAYTCCTLWHWSHGEVQNVIRDMTIQATDKQDLLRCLQSNIEKYVLFALEQFREQNLFDPDIIVAVVQVMRHGDEKLTDPALKYLAKASVETGDDSLFRSSEDELLAANPRKRVQLLETLRETKQDFPPGYLGRFSSWLPRADSYYEVHLLLTLLEREKTPPEEAIREAMSLLQSDQALVVRRSYRYLKAQKLNPSQQKQLDAFEKENPDP